MQDKTIMIMLEFWKRFPSLINKWEIISKKVNSITKRQRKLKIKKIYRKSNNKNYIYYNKMRQFRISH